MLVPWLCSSLECIALRGGSYISPRWVVPHRVRHRHNHWFIWLRSDLVIIWLWRWFNYLRNISILLNDFTTIIIWRGPTCRPRIWTGRSYSLRLWPDDYRTRSLLLWRWRGCGASLTDPNLLLSFLLLKDYTHIFVQHWGLVLDLLLMFVWIALHFRIY
jgi:hypothetical protein